MKSRTIRRIKQSGLLLLLAGIPFLSACIAFLPSATSKSEEERKWFLLDLVSSPEQNALISNPPTVGADGYDPALFTVDQRVDPEEIAVPVYGKHYVSVGHIFDIDVDTSRIPGAPEEYESVFMPEGHVAEITYEYDERMLRERGLIEEFQVYYYHKGSDRWYPLSDVEVDLENNRVIARTNHFTPFVLTALPQPADSGVFNPPQCIVDALDDPAGSMAGPKWSRLDVGFKYYLDRGYTIKHTDSFYDLELNQALGIATCNGGTHASSSIFCGPQGQHKYNTDPNYLDFSLPFDAKVYVMYDHRGTERAGWLSDMGFAQVTDTFVETTDSVEYYEVYEKDYTSGSQVTLPGNHYDLANPNQIDTNYFVAVLPQGDWATDAGIDCSGEPLRPASPEGISLIPGSDQVSIVLDQTIDRDVTGLIVRRRLQEPSLSPEYGEAVGLAIEDPGYIIDTGLTEGMTYYYSFFAVTDSGLYSPPLVIELQTGPDDDGDGLANFYENNPSIVYYGGDGTNSNLDDTDSDGIDDLTEILNLTDPTHSDHTNPVITTFEDDGTINTIPVARFSIQVDDASPITGWYLSTGTEPPPNDSTDWLTEEPTTWDVPQIGELSLNLWVRDEAGNVSEMATLELDFPNFRYASSFIRYVSGYRSVTEVRLDPSDGTPNERLDFDLNEPLNSLAYSGSEVVSHEIDDILRIWSSASPSAISEHIAASPLLGTEVTVYLFNYLPMKGIYIAGLYYYPYTTDVVEGCQVSRRCLISFKRTPDAPGIEIISAVPYGPVTGSYSGGVSELETSEDEDRFLILDIGSSGIWAGTMTGDSLDSSMQFASAPQGGLNGVGELAFSADGRYALVPRDPFYAGGSGIRVFELDSSNITYIGRYMTGSEYSGLAFINEGRILILNDDGLHSAHFNTVTGAISFRQTVLPIPGRLETKALFVDRSGTLGIVRSQSVTKVFQYDAENDEMAWVQDIDLGEFNSQEHIAFSSITRGNQAPKLSFRLPTGPPVMTNTGITYPFRDIISANLDCTDYLWFWGYIYRSDQRDKWSFGRVEYEDPDANRCGVSESPVHLTRTATTSPGIGSLETPMDLYSDIQINTRSTWQVRSHLEAIMGPIARRVCPSNLLTDGTSQTIFPITPKQVGDYSITVAATDSAGSCEGVDQTARATLHLRARNRLADSRYFFVATDQYPERPYSLRKLTLMRGDYPAPLDKPGVFEKFACGTFMLACGWIGREYGSPFCVELIDSTPEMRVDSRFASCGSQTPMIPYWHARSIYLYDGWDSANAMYYYRRESPVIPVPAFAFKDNGLGFIFLKRDEKVGGDKFYGGQWTGYEDL